MTKRILAMTLCLALTLLACACAASNATVSAPESTDNKGGNTADLSTTEQPGTSAPVTPMSSQPATSDEVSKPTEPMIPEERETTLEKVLSFEIGMDGLFEYGFLYYDKPSEAEIRIPGFLFADSEGNFYHTDDVWIVRLNDGAKFPYSNQFQCIDISTHGNLFYVLTGDGIARKYDISAGFEKAVLIEEYPLFEANVGSGEFYHTGDTEPLFRDRDGTFFTLEKEALPKEKVPFVYNNTQKSDLAVDEDGRFSIAENTNERIYVPYFSKQGIALTKQLSPDVQEAYVQSTSIYTAHSSRGELLSRFVYLVQYSTAKNPCNIQYQSGNTLYTLEKTYTQDLFVGSFSFEDVFGSNVIFGDDGCSYLAVYYSDHGEVYRIQPGYTDETFVPMGANDSADENELATSSGSFSSRSTDAGDTIKCISKTHSQVKAAALEMIRLPWTLQAEHKDPPVPEDKYEGVDVSVYFCLPTYLTSISTPCNNMTGIPYCRGGYFYKARFLEFLDEVEEDGTLYATGNIADPGEYISGTIGLDCGRFLSAAFGLSEGLHPDDILEYGHRVSSLSMLEEMDVIVKGSYYDAHAMFFQCVETNGLVSVHEVTSALYPEKTVSRTLNYNEAQLIARGYKFLHVYGSVEKDSTHHWFDCSSCTHTGNEVPHSWGYTYTATNHTSACEECTYTITENHTTGYRYNASYHWTYCTDGCGYEVSARKRAHTMQFGMCTVCGYIENVLNTRPGTEVILEQ